ncbi:MAG: hypothetical protein J6X21_09710 [Bacteroidaceae bacterium]|nr:hypothetical protein [Bacteroidaceae bacterium]
MEKTDDMLERLKGQIPEVPDAAALTDSIMAAIDNLDRKAESGIKGKSAERIPLWLTVLRTASSMVAIVLLVLYMRLETSAVGNSDGERAEYLEVVAVDECEECSPAENYNLRREKMRVMNERAILKKKIYASFDL